MEKRFEFGHERLDCGRPARSVALDVARWAAKQVFPPDRRHLRDQLVRAADSMVLNIGEGSGQEPGAARRNHYRVAAGSAGEVHSVVDLVEFPEGPARQEQLRRVGAMLWRMSRA